MRTLCEQGASIRVLTNSLMSTDVPMVHAAYGPLRRQLLAGGVQLWELRAFAVSSGRRRYDDNLSLHSKVMLIDDDISIIGSANLDPRSRNLNTELVVFIRNRACTAALRAGMDRVCDHPLSFELQADEQSSCGIRWIWSDEEGAEMSATREPQRTVWRGFLQNVYKITIPTSVL